MTHHDAVALIDTPWLRHQATPTRWADLGCGSGTFTLALAEFLAPGSSIEAIDLRPSIAPQTTKNGVSIHPRAADFTTLDLRLRAAADTASGPGAAARAANPDSANPSTPESSGSARDATPGSSPGPGPAAVLPPRLWPGTQPLVYDGIIMANSLHYVADQRSFLNRLHRAPGSASTPGPANDPSAPASAGQSATPSSPDQSDTPAAPDFLGHSAAPSAPGSAAHPETPSSISRPGALLFVEYDIDVPVAQWVPYPLSFVSAKRLLQSSGWPRIQKLGTFPSAFGGGTSPLPLARPRSHPSLRLDVYAALALPANVAP